MVMRAVLGLIAAALAANALAADVRNVRVQSMKDETRAVVELSREAEYKVFTLENPDRLVLDIIDGRLKRDIDGEGRGLVKSVRTGQPDEGRLRIVFDLTAPVRPKSFILPPADRFRHRLIVDMSPLDQVKTEEVRVAPASDQSTEQRDVVIAVDAGHGGADPGAIGPGGTYEKRVTLKVAKLLAAKINAEPGMRAVLIRDDDSFVALRDRYEKAREEKADLFVSVHADAALNRSARGSSVYVMSTRGASNEAARYLAERENRSDLIGGVSLNNKDTVLASVLLDLSQGATLEASSQVAEHLLSSLQRMGKTHKRYVERANFFVLRSPDVPSVLIETGFISNPEEERKLNDAAHRNRLAEAILGGVRDYFHAAPPPGTWIAANSTQRSHVVARGETLSEIAMRHGVTVARIRRANALPSDQVNVGKVLKIPTSS